MSLVTRSIEHLRRLNVLEPGSSFLIALSGGMDSVVLTDMFVRMKETWDIELHVAYIHHGLRKQADDEVNFVKELTASYNIPCHIEKIDVNGVYKVEGGSLQNVARNLRYNALDMLRERHGLQYIVTAHHADDQAETLIQHFFEGAGVEGLTGIRPVLGNLVRPLLFATREEIALYARERGLRWMEDESNQKSVYKRNAIRHIVIPQVKEVLNPSVQKTLSRSAGMFGILTEFLDVHSERLYDECVKKNKSGFSIAINKLESFTTAERLLVIRKVLERLGCQRAGFGHIERVEALIHSQSGSTVELPDSVNAIRERTFIAIQKTVINDITPIQVQVGDSVNVLESVFSSKEFSGNITFQSKPDAELVDIDKAGVSWCLRPWKDGDRFIPFGFQGEVLLSDFLTNNKVHSSEKKSIFVLESEKHILWVCGFRLDDRVKITSETKRIAELRFDVTK